MMKLIVGDKNLSSWSLRPWLALKSAQIPFEEVKILLDRPDTDFKIAKFSPSGKVPVLVDGDFIVYESIAICEYLAERFPESNLWPKDLKNRALARAISFEMHAGFSSLRQELPMRCAECLPIVQITKSVQEDIDRITEIWTSCRNDFGQEGDMLFGKFTIADAMFAPVATRLRTYGVKLNSPVAAKYCADLLELSPMKEWLSDAISEIVDA